MINVLMRTSNRPELFWRALTSVREQTYQDVKIIVAYDDPKALRYIPDSLDRIQVTPDKSHPFYWNLYCNELKEQVTDGWFFYLDDDDFLASNEVLDGISTKLSDPDYAVVCQFLRKGVKKPSDELIAQAEVKRGFIGGSCLFLHHSKKNVADWGGIKGSDWRWIMAVREKLPMRFVKQVVVATDNNGLKGKI